MIRGGSVVIKNSTIESNVATIGGGISLYPSLHTILHTKLQSKTVTGFHKLKFLELNPIWEALYLNPRPTIKTWLNFVGT